jgi:hypothetical protein
MKTEYMETIIEHYENGIKRFLSNEEFVKFCQVLFGENEKNDTALTRPETYIEALEYMRIYCDGFTIIQIPKDQQIKELEELARKSHNLLVHLKGKHAADLRMHLSSVLTKNSSSHLFKYQDAPKLAL